MKLLSSYYLKKLSALSTMIFFIALILFASVLKVYYLQIFPFVFLYFILMSIFFHHKLILAKEKSPIQFNSVFVGTIGIKLFLNLFFIIIYLILYRENLLPFLSFFMALYFIFLIFDVKVILSETTKLKKG